MQRRKQRTPWPEITLAGLIFATIAVFGFSIALSGCINVPREVVHTARLLAVELRTFAHLSAPVAGVTTKTWTGARDDLIDLVDEHNGLCQEAAE